MPTLVDGHNLIGQLPQLDLADPDDEAKLVMLLRRYATRKRGRRIVVIFDHGVYGHPNNLNGYGIEAVFVPPPRNADAELIRRIRAIKRIDEWQVVSSDRAVIGAAQAKGIAVVTSERFATLLNKIEQPAVDMRGKRNDRPLSKTEVEEWMRFFGYEEGEDEQFY